MAVELLSRGLNVRDIEDAFRDESRRRLSRIAGERPWVDYQEFAERDLSEHDISYLFVDGIAEHSSLLHGRLRGLHRAPAHTDQASSRDQYERAGASSGARHQR